jgi:hypothetical protein
MQILLSLCLFSCVIHYITKSEVKIPKPLLHGSEEIGRYCHFSKWRAILHVNFTSKYTFACVVPNEMEGEHCPCLNFHNLNVQ